jgi:peptidoglycan/xylan/chitin deacetylase (PgdA/CDA1 family)
MGPSLLSTEVTSGTMTSTTTVGVEPRTSGGADMIPLARRATIALVPVALAMTALPASAAVEPGPLPEGPWPPRQVLAGVSPQVAATPDVVSTGCPSTTARVRSAAPGSGKTVALTFDDGPGVTTFSLLSILQRYGVTATFFNLGLNATYRPHEVRSDATVGAQLANHTWDHPRLTDLSATAQGDQMDTASAEQKRLVGSHPCAFRPPYGSYDSASLAQAQLRRMSFWTWSVDTEDWKAGTSTSSTWVNRIISRAEAGVSQAHPVILMHNPPAGVPATVLALPTIIRYFRDHGYRFVDLAGSSSQYPAPAATTTGAVVRLAVRGPDGSLRVRTGTSTSWTAATSLGGVMEGGPGAAALSSSSTAFAVLGTDNAVWLTRTDAGAVARERVGGTGTSKPAVAAFGNRLVVAVRGTDQAVWLRERTGSTWGSWQGLGGGLRGAPALAFTADGGLTVAVVGSGGSLWVRHRGNAWGPWTRVGGAVTAEPSLAATAGGAGVVAMVRGTDDRAWVLTMSADASRWASWQRVGGVLASGAGMTPRGPTLEAYVYGTDGRVWRNVASNGAMATGWSGWRVVP